ncbi:MAG: hypothetical protein K0S64_1287 [Gaiellaceae bacterium]|nr:hypothetical protein [Gaiellaceae bacterium]
MNARTKLIGTIAVGAALFVPVAQAQSPDDRAGLRGPGGIAAEPAGGAANHPDNRAERGAGVAPAITEVAVRPDDRAGTRGPGANGPSTLTTGAISHPDNRAESRGPGSVDRVVVISSSSSFDWGDALIGSLGGVGAALLLTGCFFLVASQRNKTRLA